MRGWLGTDGEEWPGENPARLTMAVLVGEDLPAWKRSRFLGNTSRKREETG